MKWRIFSEYLLAFLVLGYMGLIFGLSSIPGTELRLVTPDYIAHALGFGGFSMLITLFLLHYFKLSSGVIFGLILTFLFALSDEAHQYFVPFRSPDWRDIAADLIGAIIVQIFLIIFVRLYACRAPKVEQDR